MARKYVDVQIRRRRTVKRELKENIADCRGNYNRNYNSNYNSNYFSFMVQRIRGKGAQGLRSGVLKSLSRVYALKRLYFI